MLSMFSFARHFYIFPAAFSATAILADILVILAPVIPFAPARMRVEFLVSAFTCMGILALMLIAVTGYIFWRRRAMVPRTPDTLANVMSYLIGSREMCSMELGEWRRKDLRYTYGKSKGIDGFSRWTIDALQ
jgi:hypothetical protein